MSKEELKTLEEQIGDDDWAIIIGKDGNLKGLFIPAGSDDEDVPESIVAIMSDYYGVDFDEAMDDGDDPTGQTIH
jgi:hypothetical protein